MRFQPHIAALWNLPQFHKNTTGWEKSQERGGSFQNTLFGDMFAEQTWPSLAPVTQGTSTQFLVPTAPRTRTGYVSLGHRTIRALGVPCHLPIGGCGKHEEETVVSQDESEGS